MRIEDLNADAEQSPEQSTRRAYHSLDDAAAHHPGKILIVRESACYRIPLDPHVKAARGCGVPEVFAESVLESHLRSLLFGGHRVAIIEPPTA